MSIYFPPPRRRKQPDWEGWPPRPRITPALIALWSLLLAGPVSMLVTGGVWFLKGWERGLQACAASAIVLVFIFLLMLYWMTRETRMINQHRPRVPKRPL